MMQFSDDLPDRSEVKKVLRRFLMQLHPDKSSAVVGPGSTELKKQRDALFTQVTAHLTTVYALYACE